MCSDPTQKQGACLSGKETLDKVGHPAIRAFVQLTGSLCVRAMLSESSGGREAVSPIQNKDRSPSLLTDRWTIDRQIYDREIMET